MDKDIKTVNTTTPAVEPKEQANVPTEDLEAKNAALEAEKARLIEENANWKLAALKAKGKTKENPEELDADEKMRQFVREEIANSRLAEINKEQDGIIKKALKENKELKLAQINRTTTPPASVGTHTEGQQVQDTLVTSEQVAAFKARGWNDKDIERYKKNLNKVSTGIGGR